VCRSSLLIAKGVDSVVAHDGFLFVMENFLLATLITQLLILLDSYRVEHDWQQSVMISSLFRHTGEHDALDVVFV